jgi:hypothetical protein
MAAEDDNFDIDIYGDGGGYTGNEPEGGDETDIIVDSSAGQQQQQPQQQNGMNGNNHAGSNETHKIFKTEERTPEVNQTPRHPLPQQQGVKRKESSDDRQADPDATCALFIAELHWWTTDDDIRGWVNHAGAEHELKDVTFSEHKVNGKSKGYVTERLVQFSAH